MDNTVIKVENVVKNFKLPHDKYNSLKGRLIHFGSRGYEVQHALKGLSFEVKKGEFFGIVGRNGSGKSTLLKMLAGIYEPTRGTIAVEGRLTPFIELGVGFNPELSGRDNVYLNGALLGFSRKQVDGMYRSIVEFAELEKFMDQKLKNYSSGMQVRLAFSIAVKADSDILLLDEVLAVGDAEFQKKCFDYFRSLKRNKKTVVFISHDMNAVKEYCDRAILINDGKIAVSGNTEKVAQAYTRLFSESAKNTTVVQGTRWGTGDMTIKALTTAVTPDTITVSMECSAHKDVEEPIFGLTIHNPVGMKVYESNTKWKHVDTGTMKAGSTHRVTWTIDNVFTNGEHLISPAIATRDATDFYDNWDEAAAFVIDKDEVTTAFTLAKSEVVIR